MNLVDLLADAYERAALKEPKNEEILSHQFMAYVRINEYKKQQLTAMALYKIKPKNPYYFWSIMSLYMQVSFKLQFDSLLLMLFLKGTLGKGQ